MAFAVKTDGEWWIRSSAKCVMVIAGSDTRHRGLERGKYFFTLWATLISRTLYFRQHDFTSTVSMLIINNKRRQHKSFKQKIYDLKLQITETEEDDCSPTVVFLLLEIHESEYTQIKALRKLYQMVTNWREVEMQQCHSSESRT
ncbi:hypothetical protein YC2023_075485 [Brassica napus]